MLLQPNRFSAASTAGANHSKMKRRTTNKVEPPEEARAQLVATSDSANLLEYEKCDSCATNNEVQRLMHGRYYRYYQMIMRHIFWSIVSMLLFINIAVHTYISFTSRRMSFATANADHIVEYYKGSNQSLVSMLRKSAIKTSGVLDFEVPFIHIGACFLNNDRCILYAVRIRIVCLLFIYAFKTTYFQSE